MESRCLGCVGHKSAVMIERDDVVADWQSVCRDWRVPVARSRELGDDVLGMDDCRK